MSRSLASSQGTEACGLASRSRIRCSISAFSASVNAPANFASRASCGSGCAALLGGLVSNAIRRQGDERVHGGEPLDAAREVPGPIPVPSERAISQEEEAILWRSLERIPGGYREALVLSYREHQSLESVAQALELSEDGVKRRFSRGRKFLREQVLAFVEAAYEQCHRPSVALERTKTRRNCTLSPGAGYGTTLTL